MTTNMVTKSTFSHQIEIDLKPLFLCKLLFVKYTVTPMGISYLRVQYEYAEALLRDRDRLFRIIT